ncbi:MAG: hypothetical protein COX62_00925 [Deltaproteobacteria bacterium CG_4_10_14_0_2_um_filter_43_8]|nr:MAG: hypothetical protein COV43_06890 [Deltaproteobacteria bacterium CG11_big_fil_rev_8_21_14_0_20_42_23]PJA22016.1 MAG: hypothetical protein COX62_00925 [Deltaproteobacteria bacterium CG_4_10_14_0_2_um_filter_43_8]PJC65241.1 MAG: hypothetical protein CO021_00195 [Deltaproteobacteria bacterium CG_4_9_14_0_2_um_filter_42_21]
MYVGIVKLKLHLPACESFDEKQEFFKRSEEIVLESFNLPLAEVGCLEEEQMLELGYAIVGAELGEVESATSAIIDLILEQGDAQVLDEEVDILTY